MEVTNAQVGAALRTAAESLGLTFAGLAGLIVAHLQRAKLIEADGDGDGSLSLAAFDAECSRSRREFRQRRAVIEDRQRLEEIGHEAVPATEREEAAGNPDAMVANAIALLERRTPRNWGAMVCGAFGLLRQAVAAELARPIVSRRQFFERCETLRAVGPEADGDPEGSEGLE